MADVPLKRSHSVTPIPAQKSGLLTCAGSSPHACGLIADISPLHTGTCLPPWLRPALITERYHHGLEKRFEIFSAIAITLRTRCEWFE
ncbi:MAG TPA: hypothetical protein VKV04_07450 [Verrucomicrobiae bacterium]|nr:hypothetical protein [Verrucomicrobiae bacterium]